MTAGPTSFFARAHEGDFANIEKRENENASIVFVARERIVGISAAGVECKNRIKTQERCRIFAHACDARMCEKWTGLSGAGLVG